MKELLWIPILILAVVIWLTYHKIVVTYYFSNMASSIYKEFIVCIFVSAIIVSFFAKFLIYIIGIAVVVSVIVFISSKSKKDNSTKSGKKPPLENVSQNEKDTIDTFVQRFKKLGLAEKKNVLMQVKKKAETENTVATKKLLNECVKLYNEEVKKVNANLTAPKAQKEM